MEENPTSFPLRDLLEAAEHLPRGRAVPLRQYGLLRLVEATDSQLGEYSGHKGLRFYVPESYVPMLAPQRLVEKVRRVVYSRDQQRPVAVEVQIVGCEATDDDLQQQAPEWSGWAVETQSTAAGGKEHSRRRSQGKRRGQDCKADRPFTKQSKRIRPEHCRRRSKGRG